MCVSMLARVVAIDATGALVAADKDLPRRAGTLLYPDVRVGEWVLVGAGTIIQRLTPDEARLMAEAVPEGASDAVA